MESITAEPAENVKPTLAQLIHALPEIYQPIYGHPEFSTAVSRSCDDRLTYLEAVWRDIGRALGRRPRVLDLGCAQGYISLHLAALGASVIGVDHCTENIAVCQALAGEHPEWNAQFIAANIEQLFEIIDLSQIDMVLGLSVFHHMARAHGYEAVTQWISTLGAHVAVCIFELALAEEPVHWASAQPIDERKYVGGFSFTHELARLPTHLSEIRRPLIFASNYLWYFNGSVDLFTSMTRSSHDDSLETCAGTRRYLMNDRCIAKIYSLRDAFPILNRTEIINEATFLTEPPEGFFPVPQPLACGITEREAWLVRERLPGRLLYDLLCADEAFDAKSIIADILKQLAILESKGLYHNDVTTWNVLVMPDGSATLIDYGSISPFAESFSWPQNLFSSFWIFVWCVATRSKWSGKTLTPPFSSPHNLPDPFAVWSRMFWQVPAPLWTFSLLASTFDATMDTVPEAPVPTALDSWQQNTETYLMELAERMNTMYDIFLGKSSIVRSD